MARKREIEQSSSTRVKFGYLTYNEMLDKLANGEVDAYDVIFTKDTYLTYIISPDLIPVEIKARVYIFNSIEEANVALNEASDTYAGQIVSILQGDVYKGYIVNLIENTYSVSPLDDSNYNSLSNVPIVNLTGSIDNQIIVDSLPSGVYKITGQYKISESDSTVYLSASGDLFLIHSAENEIHIKRFTSDNIYDFSISDTNKEVTFYVTKEYLETLGYATTDHVDSKTSALEESLKQYVQEYVGTIIAEQLDDILDERIEAKIDEKIQPTESNLIEGLFE